jgi:hypothetical protein
LLVVVGDVFESFNENVECSRWCSEIGFIFVLECVHRSIVQSNAVFVVILGLLLPFILCWRYGWWEHEHKIISLLVWWCRLWHDDLWNKFVDGGGGIKDVQQDDDDGWTPVQKQERNKISPYRLYIHTHQTTQIIVSSDH